MGIWPNSQFNHKTKKFPVDFPKKKIPDIIYNIPILHLNINPKENIVQAFGHCCISNKNIWNPQIS